MRRPAGSFDGADFVEGFGVVARQKGVAVDDHINLVCALADRAAHLLEFCAQRILSAGKTGRDRGNVHGGVIAQKTPRVAHHVRIHADCRAGRDLVFRFGRLQRFAAEIGDFAGRIFAFKRGEIHHRSYQFQPGEFGGGFNAAFGERCGPLLGHHLVHA